MVTPFAHARSRRLPLARFPGRDDVVLCGALRALELRELCVLGLDHRGDRAPGDADDRVLRDLDRTSSSSTNRTVP